jgi:tetratricopeptide (TPR) repeat protein
MRQIVPNFPNVRGFFSAAFAFSFLTLIGLFLSACSSSSSYVKRSDLTSGGGGVFEVDEQKTVQRRIRKQEPWEVFAKGRNFLGESLRSDDARLGDAALSRGDTREALRLYRKALSGYPSMSDEEAIIYRVASVELSSDSAEAALSTLSRYFQEKSKDENDIDARFALLFAYAYGARGDVEQSLAWFSQASRSKSASPTILSASTSGIRGLLRKLPAQQFEMMSLQWKGDTTINRMIAEERYYRQTSNQPTPSRFAGGRFWDALRANSLFHLL